jgi:hypothetical protein
MMANHLVTISSVVALFAGVATLGIGLAQLFAGLANGGLSSTLGLLLFIFGLCAWVLGVSIPHLAKKRKRHSPKLSEVNENKQPETHMRG